MKINVRDIKENVGDSCSVKLSAALEEEKINGQLVLFTEPLDIRLNIINADQEYALMGDLDVVAQKSCSRCLEDVEFSLSIDFSTEVDKSVVEDDEVDISDYIIEHIRLAMPMQVICDEDCQGLCPSCGIDLNYDECDCMMHEVDPRLAKLEKLLDR